MGDKNKWIAGWGNGLTGPTTVLPPVTVSGSKWPTMPISCGHSTIAVVIAQKLNESEQELKSRASLMASAPALLEALEDMFNQGCGNYSKKSCGHDFYCVCPGDKARTAIAAARGE